MLSSSALPNTFQIFISSSDASEDEVLLKKLEIHLSPLRRQNIINDWHNRKITPGTDQQNDVDEHLHTSHLILLLVSADYLASDYCYGVEIDQAMRRYSEGKSVVIPIILRPVKWKRAPFGNLEALPTGGKPITSWQDRDAAFMDVVEGIEKALEKLVAVAGGFLYAASKSQLDSKHTDDPHEGSRKLQQTASKRDFSQLLLTVDGKKIKYCKLSLQKLRKQLSDTRLQNMYQRDYNDFRRNINDVVRKLKSIKDKELLASCISSVDALLERIKEVSFEIEAFFTLFGQILYKMDENELEGQHVEDIKNTKQEFYASLSRCQRQLDAALKQIHINSE